MTTARELKFKILSSGSHNPNGKACLMEAVAYIAGEPWSDYPECACPVLAAYGRNINDAIPGDALRTELLLPLVPLLVGTLSTLEVEVQRAEFLARYTIRVIVPKALRTIKLDTDADALAALPEDVGMGDAELAARSAVKSAARSVARSAAWSAVESAAQSAESAAWSVESAAWSAESAARSVARSAAWSAARSAARSAESAARSAAMKEVYTLAVEGLRMAIAVGAAKP